MIRETLLFLIAMGLVYYCSRIHGMEQELAIVAALCFLASAFSKAKRTPLSKVY